MNIEDLSNQLSSIHGLSGFWILENDGMIYALENSPYEVILESNCRGFPKNDYLVAVRDVQADKQMLSATTDSWLSDAINSFKAYPPDIVFEGEVLR